MAAKVFPLAPRFPHQPEAPQEQLKRVPPVRSRGPRVQFAKPTPASILVTMAGGIQIELRISRNVRQGPSARFQKKTFLLDRKETKSGKGRYAHRCGLRQLKRVRRIV